jgi:hypothetical protein
MLILDIFLSPCAFPPNCTLIHQGLTSNRNPFVRADNPLGPCTEEVTLRRTGSLKSKAGCIRSQTGMEEISADNNDIDRDFPCAGNTILPLFNAIQN